MKIKWCNDSSFQTHFNDSYIQTYLFFLCVCCLVPDYLRTKYDPEIEESEQKLETMATSIPPDQAQVNWRKSFHRP